VEIGRRGASAAPDGDQHDEGEPGTFKDRWYLERDPTGSSKARSSRRGQSASTRLHLLRDEYHGCRAILEKEIAALQANPPCKLPPIHLRRGAGAYICGEESAMIESIEGKRGMPRLRRLRRAGGLFNRPTLEHNMETLHWVREILEKGADWFASQGRNGRKGLRSFSVSGRVKSPACISRLPESREGAHREYCGGMPDGQKFYGYLPGALRAGFSRHRWPIYARLRYLNQYGCFIGSPRS